MKTDVDYLIKTDLYRYGGLSGTKGFYKAFLLYPGFRYTYFMRKAAVYSKYSIRGLYFKFFVWRYTFKYGFQIPAATKIGEGFYIGHFGTIVINSSAVIGNNCNIAHGVTIGETFRGKLMGTPSIGNKVWIGTGSVIVGKVTIGSNVLIAPNSYVNFSVPDNSLVLGNPAKITASDNPTEGYINNIL